MLRRVVVAALLVAAVVLPRAGRAQAVNSAPNLDRLRALIRDRLQAASAPSLAIAVVMNGKIAWEEAFGSADLERHTPSTPDTPYYLASITKTLTGAALLGLADRGQLDLDRPINSYLGRAKLHSPLWDVNGATVRRVANHTAGLTTYARTCDTEAACAMDGAIEKYGVIVRAPGATFDYSNLGYGILGDVLGRVSKSSYAMVLRNEIFQPLKMTSCAVSTPPAHAAVPYDSGTHRPAILGASGHPGASSAFCSVHDLALFMQWVMTNGPLVDTIRALPVPAGGGQQYAFGWWLPDDYFGYRPLSGSGGTNYSSAALRVFPGARMAVAVLINAGTELADSIIDETLAEFVPRIRDARIKAAGAPAAAAVPGQRPAPEDDLPGNWTGFVTTPAGKRSLSLEIAPSGDVRASLDGQPSAPFTRGAAVRRRVGGRMPGDLRNGDAPAPPYDLDLGLELQRDRLIGFVTTHVRDGQAGPALSYWVELQKPAAAVVTTPRLVLSRPVARILTASTTDTFVVELNAGDRAAVALNQTGQMDAATFLPDGQRLNELPPPGPEGERYFAIDATQTGAYQIRISAKAGQSSATYEIELEDISTRASRQARQPAPDPDDRNQTVTVDDLRILERADAVLAMPGAWSRHDTRICLPADSTYSLYCALEKAQLDLFGEYRHRAVAPQEVRFAVEDVTNGFPFRHRLRDYNNLPSTQFADIKRVLTIASHRVRVRLDAQKTN